MTDDARVPADPRQSDAVVELANKLKSLEYHELQEELKRVKDRYDLGWARYHFKSDSWQYIVINRYLTRDTFLRNILPAWVGAIFGILSFAVAVLALVVALKVPKP